MRQGGQGCKPKARFRATEVVEEETGRRQLTREWTCEDWRSPPGIVSTGILKVGGSSPAEGAEAEKWVYD